MPFPRSPFILYSHFSLNSWAYIPQIFETLSLSIPPPFLPFFPDTPAGGGSDQEAGQADAEAAGGAAAHRGGITTGEQKKTQ